MKEEIQKLRDEILRLDNLYYNDGESGVEDSVYDSMKRRLRELEGDTNDPYSPLNVVGAKVSDTGFPKNTHHKPMLSLENVYNENELIEWIMSRGIDPDVVVEYKHDGASLSLLYRDGVLQTATTRGDGIEGDEITDNAVYFAGVPINMSVPYKGRIEIRGEVVCGREDFAKATERRKEQGKRPYANPRNMVAGVMRRKDASSIMGMGLRFIAYDAVLLDTDGPSSLPLSAIADHLVDFEVSEPVYTCKLSDSDKIMEVIERVALRRDKLDHDIDGMVIKIDDIKMRDRLGSTSTAPRWAVAYKFEAESTTSILEAVDVQVGRMGALTPVAKIKPVALKGVTVSSVTLHNFDEIDRLDVRLGDTVIVSRRGDVIPKIEGVVTALRVDDHGKISAPVACPSCGGEVKRIPGQVELRCVETMTCPAQVIGKLSHFVSRDGVGIMHFGEATVEALVATGALASFSSIYHLSEADFYAAGLGEAMTDKVMANIEKSRKVPFYKVLRSIGIDDVGDGTATRLAKRYKSFAELKDATVADLVTIPDIGETTAESIVQYFVNNPFDALALDKELTYIDDSVKPAEVQDLLGKRVVVTGSNFEGKTRKEMETDVVARGGTLSSSISKNTDYIYAGSGAGPDKMNKASELGFVKDAAISYVYTNPALINQ